MFDQRRTDHEVLHAAFRTKLGFLVEGHQNVTGKAGQLEANEQHEQVLGEGHRAHAKRAGQEQDVEVSLATVVVQGTKAAHLACWRGAVAVVGRQSHQEKSPDEQGFHQSTERCCGKDANAVITHSVNQHFLLAPSKIVRCIDQR